MNSAIAVAIGLTLAIILILKKCHPVYALILGAVVRESKTDGDSCRAREWRHQRRAYALERRFPYHRGSKSTRDEPG